jgi:hypothetical protein
MIVFALRMVEATALWGDRIMWIMRFVSPSFSLCNSIIFSSSRLLLKAQREDIRDNLKKKILHLPNWQKYFPKVIYHAKPFHPDNILGDIIMIVFHAFFWMIFVIVVESCS